MPDFDLTKLNLDWKLAGQRLAKDARDDFWPDPLRYGDVLRGDIEAELGDLLSKYRPVTARPYSLPKANFTIRDSIHLRPIDRLVYQALVDRIIPMIDTQFLPTVYSHRLRSPDSKWMFHGAVAQWKLFLQAAKSRLLSNPNSYLVVTDVARYFETISFRPLSQQLEHLLEDAPSDSKPIVSTLVQCLNAWTPYEGFGLVQNTDASSFLGNTLLDYVDKRMEGDGYEVLRYMDDIRIVVPTEADARKALMRLVVHLRKVGLGLNSAKTAVIGPTDLARASYVADDDAEIEEIEAGIGTKTKEGVQEIVPLVFSKADRMVARGDTSDRVFRFCLNRITTLRQYGNLDFPDTTQLTQTVLEQLVERPAETATYCRYLETAPLNDTQLAEIVRLLTSEPLFVYPWQSFRVWQVACQRGVQSKALVRRAHELLREHLNSPESAAAALYLAMHGSYADTEAIRTAALSAPRGLVQRSLSIALQRLPKKTRNPAWGEISGGEFDSGALTGFLSGLQAPKYVEAPAPLAIEDLPDAMPSVYA